MVNVSKMSVSRPCAAVKGGAAGSVWIQLRRARSVRSCAEGLDGQPKARLLRLMEEQIATTDEAATVSDVGLAYAFGADTVSVAAHTAQRRRRLTQFATDAGWIIQYRDATADGIDCLVHLPMNDAINGIEALIEADLEPRAVLLNEPKQYTNRNERDAARRIVELLKAADIERRPHP